MYWLRLRGRFRLRRGRRGNDAEAAHTRKQVRPTSPHVDIPPRKTVRAHEFHVHLSEASNARPTGVIKLYANARDQVRGRAGSKKASAGDRRGTAATPDDWLREAGGTGPI